MSINRVTISGNLTKNAELKETAGGTAVLAFSVAVNDSRKNAQGKWEQFPNYVDCHLFGARATALANHLVKGTKVFVDGKLRWSQWEKNGEKRSKLEVIVEEIEFSKAEAKPPKVEAKPSLADFDDEIPF